MKRALIISLLALLCQYGLEAQEVITSTNYQFPVKEAIVRQWESQFPATVSYCLIGEHHYFVYTDQTMVMNYMEIDPRFDVRDFVVSENHVYFCGRDTVTDRGLFGWFEAAPGNHWGQNDYYYRYTFFSGFDLTNPMLPKPVHIKAFNSIVLIEEADSARLVLVGEDEYPSGCVVRMAGEFPLSGTEWQYTCAKATLSSETFDHVVLTDDYVVTGGTEGHAASQTCHRFFDRNNYITSTGIHDYQYCYPTNNPDPTDTVCFCYPVGDFAMTGMSNNQFAVLSRYTKCNKYKTHQGFILLVFDIAQTLSQTNVNQAGEAYLPTFSHLDVNGLCFSDRRSSFLGLVDAKPFGYAHSFLLETPYPFGASLDVHYDGGLTTMLSSLDNYHSQQAIVAIGSLGLNAPDLRYYYHPVNASLTCFSHLTLPFFSDRVFSEKHHYLPLELFSSIFQLGKLTPVLSEMPNNEACRATR
ncbi:MAG: hypothetical protein K5864_04415 [Bacteroidales bacterium]|nr:hypothetical protein [Bacteroidales bacterium]